MPRLQLQPLAAYDFRCELTVRTTDLNYGGHLGNDRLLALVHEARVAFLAAAGLSELDAGGASLIMADAAVVYQGEAFAGDVLRFDMAAREPGRLGFRLCTRVTRVGDRTPVAIVETGLVCFDYRAREARPLTPALRALCVPAGGD